MLYLSSRRFDNKDVPVLETRLSLDDLVVFNKGDELPLAEVPLDDAQRMPCVMPLYARDCDVPYAMITAGSHMCMDFDRNVYSASMKIAQVLRPAQKLPSVGSSD